jgi:hypothetical protein
VEREGDDLLVWTCEDHGLTVEGAEGPGGGGSTREFCHPMRHFSGTNRLTIHALACSQRAPAVCPPGGAFMGPTVEVVVEAAAGVELLYCRRLGDVEPAWLPHGAPILPIGASGARPRPRFAGARGGTDAPRACNADAGARSDRAAAGRRRGRAAPVGASHWREGAASRAATRCRKDS